MKQKNIYKKKMQGNITAWELVIERRSCSFSCSAALFCSLETILFCALALSDRSGGLAIAFSFMWCLIFFCYELCWSLYGLLIDGMGSQIYMTFCKESHMIVYLSQFLHKQILHRFSPNFHKYPFSI